MEATQKQSAQGARSSSTEITTGKDRVLEEKKVRKSNLGRPAGRNGDEVKAALLAAAQQHFLVREFKAVSIRQIAETAGVNGAMVNYYFASKQGLYLAMVEVLFESLEESMSALGSEDGISIADFSRSYSKLLAENPWWPNFMIREVLFSEGEVKTAIMARISSTIAPRLLKSLQSGIDSGQFRQNLNPGFALTSLMGMIIFPFLARPIIEPLLNVEITAATADALALHNTQLFLHGVQT